MSRGDNRPAPMALAIMICDTTIRDGETGKISVINSFNNIGSSVFPCVHPTLTVFLSLTDVIGEVTLRVDLLRIDDEGADDQTIFSTGDLPLQGEDPRLVYEIPIRLNGASFSQPGEYRFHLYANEEYVIGRRFFVTATAEGKPGDEPQM
ncbi:MAG TPA: hypothetical protein VGN57_01900 [Pirellulaceae bacterium]|jgi:hypothetical protein|nr:hypothetical protein [Pirellulaceae bacterium]